MFRSARLKLTGWYLLIIMFVSISFSMIIYSMISTELDRSLRIQKFRIYNPGYGISIPVPAPSPDPEVLNDARERLIWRLINTNAVIILISGAAGYFLAGRTLQPIEEMVHEQNRFVADASHELRTPLTSLKTAIEVNLRDDNLTIDEAKEVLKSNLEEVNNLQLLSDGLIHLAQNNTTSSLNLGEVNIKTASNDAVKTITPMAVQKNITIHNNSEELQIKGDTKSITELFMILLDNAIKYSSENTNIFIDSTEHDGKAIIKIKDEGVGIAPEDIPHIFDRFYRADKSRTKSDAVGYGLGLSIAKKIVENHSGQIVVKSKRGEGTQFTITVPIK